MAVKVRLQQMVRKGLKGKWYAKKVKMGEVRTKDLAQKIQHRCSVTEADVLAVINALVYEMNSELQEGKTVALDGFGRFHLTVQSEMVEKPEDFSLVKHVKRVICKFIPEAHRRSVESRRLKHNFCDDVQVEMLPFNERSKGQRKA